MSKDYIIENGIYGKKLIPTSYWNKKFPDLMKKINIVELELNYAKGWKIEEISFLKEIPFVESLVLISHHLDDISPIHNLHSLKKLIIDDYSNAEINFTQFPKL